MRIETTPTGWTAVDGERRVGASGRWERPDGKRFAWIETASAEAAAALCAAMAEGRPLYTSADGDDRDALLRLGAAGFVGDRYGHRWRLRVPVAAAWSEEPLRAFAVGPPERYAAGALRRFDDELRADVPGLHGWRWRSEGWEAEHSGPNYDPELYPVAHDADRDRFAGLVRVWDNPARPRLDLVAAARPYRGTGLAAALLGRAFRVLRERGCTEVDAECDASNGAAKSFLYRAGGRITGGRVELVYRPG
ncbi:hypothetical protein GCM10009853_018470 [Glycomyces scopariae]